MQKIILNLDKNKKYLVAVSGGSDSMALLDCMYNQGFSIHVAHVNYQKRFSSDRDQKIVEEYCHARNIIYHILVNDEHPKGNFQDWARRYRYSFFQKLYQENQCAGLVTAHHKNDFIETYLMKKERFSLADDLGIATHSFIYQMDVYRPLLGYYKEELIHYCHDHQIDYGVDETNFSRRYRRNVIRMEQIEVLDKQQLESLYQTIVEENKQLKQLQNRIKNIYSSEVKMGSFQLSNLLQLTEQEQRLFLYHYLIDNKLKDKDKLSQRYLDNLIKTLSSDKPNLNIKIGAKTLLKSYDRCYLEAKQEFKEYCYRVIDQSPFSSEYFVFNQDEGLLFSVSKDDFPLTIRSYQSLDEIKIGNGHKKIRRFFIDKKVPLAIRKKIPIVVNQKGLIIFIPHLYTNKDTNLLQTDEIMLKLKSLTQT